MSNIGKHGDSTTTGGFVIATLSTMFNHGARLAVAGDKATCGNCKGAWPVVATGNHMSDHGRAVVLNWDWVLCPCKKNRVIAQAENMGYNHRRGEVHATAAAVPMSAEVVALGTAEAASRTPAATPAAPVRNKESTTERRCTLRIGVFFDGTGNNASNTALFAQCKASTGDALSQSEDEQHAIAVNCKPYMLKAHSSYEGGYTNVWRLYQLYRNSTDAPPSKVDEDYFIPIYVEGIGTTAGKPDTLLPGYMFGTGETGMLQRVNEAIVELIPKQISVFGQRHADTSIEAIEFDVFGFSRGAAAARHFVNEINRKKEGPLAQPLRSTGATLAGNFDASKDIRIGFVGLFDTVVSYASLTDGFNLRAGHTGPLHVGLPAGCARQVVQLAARDEHRANFMLTTVTPQHREIKLPGVHSDIGGGYNSTNEDDLMLIEPVRSNESMDMYHAYEADKSHLSQSQAWREAERQRQIWKERLGGINDGHLTVEGWMVLQHRQTSRSDVVKRPIPVAYATVRLQRPIDPSYQLIALRMMHKLATESGVQWGLSPDDVPEMMVPPELQFIASKLLADQSLDEQEQALLARQYLHQSANWNFGQSHYLQSGVSIKLLYPNRPERNGERTELPNA